MVAILIKPTYNLVRKCYDKIRVQNLNDYTCINTLSNAYEITSISTDKFDIDIHRS